MKRYARSARASHFINPETGEGYGVKSFGWNGIVRKMFSCYHPRLGDFGEALAAASGSQMWTVKGKDFTLHSESEPMVGCASQKQGLFQGFFNEKNLDERLAA